MQRRSLLLAGLGLGAAAATAPAPAGAEASASGPISTAVGQAVRTRDGVSLFLREWGVGTPTLFVHSWGLSSRMWDYQFAALGEQGLRCLGFDRRGHGRSDIPPGGYDMDTLADDLAQVIAHIGAGRVNMVAHSMGAAEVVRYLARHGSARIDKVVLLSPTTPYLLQGPDNPKGASQAFLDRTRAAWRRDLPRWSAENRDPFFTPETSPEMKVWLNPVFLATPLGVLLACNRALVETDFRPDLKRIDRPVLVIHGDKDASAPLDLTGRPTAAGIAGARLEVYPGAPHGLFLTHMDQINRDVLTFLTA